MIRPRGNDEWKQMEAGFLGTSAKRGWPGHHVMMLI